MLERTFRAPIDDVWASITEPEWTARWLGPWKGEGAPGRTVELTMSAEDGAPAAAVRIEACAPPRHLRVAMNDAAGTWRLEAELIEADGITTLRLTHPMEDSADPASTGPGWEYYLDRLVARATARRCRTGTTTTRRTRRTTSRRARPERGQGPRRVG